MFLPWIVNMEAASWLTATAKQWMLLLWPSEKTKYARWHVGLWDGYIESVCVAHSHRVTKGLTLHDHACQTCSATGHSW